jgi:hypothetical protein
MGGGDIVSEPLKNKMQLKFFALSNLALTQKILDETEKMYDPFFLSWIGCNERKNHLTLQSLKGIVQPFELGGETTLIRSAVKY